MGAKGIFNRSLILFMRNFLKHWILGVVLSFFIYGAILGVSRLFSLSLVSDLWLLLSGIVFSYVVSARKRLS